MGLNAKFVAETGLALFGTAPPLEEELLHAGQLLAGAPTEGSPLDVARHLAAITDTNQDGESYIAEWSKRSNPLIVAFFGATNYPSEGLTDQVRWCAAFVNWCLRHARVRDTNSASSGSFRCFGAVPTPPSPGDIAVFKNPGQDKPCEGFGHVGFWLSETGTHVEVLGGNQSNRIRIQSYAKISADLTFLSARRPPA